MNNIKTRNKLFTLLLLVMALLIPQWGWAQTKASKGDGSSNNPFLITTAEELKWYASYVNGESGDNVVHNTACAKLMKDIDLSTVCGKDKGNWTPIAKYGTYTEDSGKNFEGVFDGNGHTISNLYINDENGSNCGLFGYIYLSTAKTSVHDLKMDNVQIVGKEDCAAVCGSGFLVTFENIEIISGSISGLQNVYGISGCNGNAKNCINRADVTAGSFYAAGVICNIKNGNKVSNCSNYGKITAGKGNAGGIASSSDGATKLENCANYGDIVLTKAIKNEVGGLVGAPWNLTINNCANFGNIYLQEKSDLVGVVVGTEKLKKASGILANTGKIYVGGVAQVDVPVLQSGISWSNNKVDNTATCLTPAAEDLASGLLAWQLQKNCSTQTWGQKVSVEPKDKYPVIGSEYKVYAGNVTFNCKTYKVMSGSFTNNATSSAFKYQHGQIDHHAATATCTKATKEYWQCQDCQRTYSDEPLTKELTDITQPALGHTYNYDGYCIRCKQYVDVKPSQKNGVYLIAEPYHLVWFRAYVNGTIVDDGEAAGTAHPTASAMLTANIDLKGYCHAADASQKLEERSWEPIGNRTNPYKGTFDGNGKTISNLYINASQDNMGLFGHINQSTIKDLTLEDAKVTNTGSYTGILAGCARDDASTLQNIKISKTCQIQAKGDKSDYTGGIVGAFYGYAYNCVNYATVEGRQCVGGLFGKYSGTGNSITACANYGNITATRWNAGGLVGSFNYGTIQDCANYGYVEGKERVGGMAGHVYEGKIKNVFCYGSIRATEDTPSVGMALGYSYKGTTEGMVAYYSRAKLTVNDQAQKVRAFGENTISEDNATGFTATQLKNGVVAYLLQQNASIEAKWGQNLANGGDIYPIIGSGHQVYANNVTLYCKTNDVMTGSFTNNTISSAFKYHHGQIDHHAATATCTKAGTKEYWQCQDCKRTYSDEPLTEELTDVTQPALGHINNADGYCSRCQPYGVKPSLENEVYQIAEPCHLAWFRDYVNGTIVDDGEKAGTAHPTASAKLTEDIDLKGYCYAADKTQSLNELSWVPIGNKTNSYQGTFDGNGKTISGLYINASQESIGLFGYTNKGTIKDLTLESAKVTNTKDYTGILVGLAVNGSTLQNIKISDSCEMNGASISGGIAGELTGNAYNCVNYATVQGKNSVGGLFGDFIGNSITAACANYGDVKATSNDAGGLVGFFTSGKIQNCANYGNVTATSNNADGYNANCCNVGGLAGYFNSGTFQDCANYGDVKGDDSVAGMVGYVYQGKIQNVFSYGSISTSQNTEYIGMAYGYSKQGTTEGMVAYYSGAKLTINDQPQEVRAFGGNTISEDNATGFTEEQLKSGKVAWLLNAGQTH